MISVPIGVDILQRWIEEMNVTVYEVLDDFQLNL
jgi:hypothetical protein